ncbi:tyrosine-type recombinase/integrase [Cytobacillus praedii]|uniref:Site-specific integrase n=1 Tax=Cytobacillus praedii TaxID=1742358 RepID=A0A4R1ANR0_9BACI|nr:site-specific integrase [Cytobacillus praedii]TCJ01332.1 site-specific integrase [Cytobacillus praedii]
MANIRPRGEKSFVFTVEAGYDANGKRERRYKTIKIEDKALLKTKKKLNDYLEAEYHKFKTEVEAGEYIVPEKLTLELFVTDWETKYAVKELAETTLANYLSHIKNHILPAIGHMMLIQIKPMHLINLLDKAKRADGSDKLLSERTKQDIYLALRNIFERAVEWKIIKDNPVNTVKKPRINEDQEVNVYDEDEISALFIAAENEPFHWRMFLTLVLAAGLRRSEALGLEWPMVDFGKGTIDIKQAITKGRKGPVIKGPKSKKSKRLISLPSSVINEFESYHLHWKKEKMKMRDMWVEEKYNWVFCNEDGTHFYPDTPTTWWTRFTKRVGVRYIKLHDLRHTSATLLINQGVHAKIISERLGHSDIRVTMNTYGHVLRKADQEAANKLDGLFTKKSKVSNS